MKKRLPHLLSLITALGLIASLHGQNLSQLSQHLQAEYGAHIRIHPSSGYVSFLRFPAASPLPLAGQGLKEKAWNFLDDYGKLWALNQPQTVLIFREQRTDPYGNHHLVFTQQLGRVPVFDGELRLHFSPQGLLRAVSGFVLPEQNIQTTPFLEVQEAATIATRLLEKEYDKAASLASTPSLLIYHQGLTRQQQGDVHLVYELEMKTSAGHHDYVYLDAHTGQLVERLPGNCSLINRRVYHTNTSNLVWAEGNAFPGSLTTEQQRLVIVTAHSYNLFHQTFGRNSFDGGGATMHAVANASLNNCPNANWNGSSTNFCTGLAVDDVIGHEWGHAYTQYTNSLIYAWESGAINEAFSDIWGETIDLINNYGSDSGHNTLRTACNSSLRWQIGEESSLGALRDMWNPNCKGDPGSMLDGSYYCNSGDSGGVHTNSGIPNHAYALLVDGGSYNGYTINSIGLTKAAHLFWQVQSQYLGRTSDFHELADALEAACADLIGANLKALTTNDTDPGFSGDIFLTADCDAVADVVAATELRTPNDCGFLPMLDPFTPEDCAVSNEAFQYLLEEDFEAGFGSWTTSEVVVNPGSWDPRSWEIYGGLPNGRGGSAAYGVDPYNGDCSTDLENGILQLNSPTISVPANVSADIILRFTHYASMELNWDGGNLQYRVNSDPWLDISGALFEYNAYNGALNSAGAGNDNPLAGKAAFTGADEGSTSGSWATSIINFGNQAGSTLAFRWQLGTDGCNGWDGWYVDDVQVGYCIDPTLLPLEWLSFKAKPSGQDALLHWSTANEQGISGFYLERKAASEHAFKQVAWVEANNQTYNAYQYIDQEVAQGHTWHYRLRQEDLDGSFSYSPIQKLVFANTDDKLQLHCFPNPSHGQLNIQWTTPKLAQKLRLLLYRSNGQVIKTLTLPVQQQHLLEVSDLPQGVYFLEATNEQGQRWFQKLVRL